MSRDDLVRQSFYPLLRTVDVPRIRFHDLGHTTARLLLGQGIHPKIVSDLLGGLVSVPYRTHRRGTDAALARLTRTRRRAQ